MIQGATQPIAVVLIMGGLLCSITSAVRVEVYLWVQDLPLVSLLELNKSVNEAEATFSSNLFLREYYFFSPIPPTTVLYFRFALTNKSYFKHAGIKPS